MFRVLIVIIIISNTYSQSSIEREFTKHPLKVKFNKSLFGFELNPISLYLSSQSEANSKIYLSLSASYFSSSSNTELSIPLVYIKDGSSKVLNIGFHYRKFAKNEIDGFYFSALSRFTVLQGYVFTTGSNSSFGSDYKSALRLGLGIGLGFRNISENGFFWGVSIYSGLYLNSSRGIFKDSILFYDNSIFLDMDILKFGYAF